MSSTTNHETFVANEDLSTHQYKLMVNSANQLVARADTAGEATIGLLQTKPTSGRTASVAVLGKSRCFAGGTITAGANITATASATATAVASGDYILGNALTGVASGGLFMLEITHAGWKGQ